MSREELLSLLMGLGYDTLVEYMAPDIDMAEIIIHIMKDGISPPSPGETLTAKDREEGPKIDITVSTYVWEWETIQEAEDRCFEELSNVLGIGGERDGNV